MAEQKQPPTKPGLKSVIIVGAGPSGLLLALLLSSLSPRPQITILDAASTLDTAPRATHYGPAAIQVLRRAGILAQVRATGYMPSTICWRKLNGTWIAGLDRALLHGGEDVDGTTILPVGELSQLILGVLQEKGCGDVRWGERVVEVGDQEGVAWVVVESGEGGRKVRYEADFVVGCDGGASGVRRCLFGSGNFPGFTWEQQIVATNTYYDFPSSWSDTQFIIHPENWYMAARISSTEPLWRISYGELPGLSPEELLARQPMKFQQMLPGRPTPDQYTIKSISPYKVHQRCVPRMAVGRICLAADAAHLCNPFGGLGLTGGIVDVEGLFDCLRGIHATVAGLEILDIYSEVRIAKWRDIVNPISSANIRRMFDLDPEMALEKDEFLRTCKRAETDKELSKGMQSASVALKYDFTQHYRTNDLSDGVGNRAVDASTRIDTEDAVAIAAEAVAS